MTTASTFLYALCRRHSAVFRVFPRELSDHVHFTSLTLDLQGAKDYASSGGADAPSSSASEKIKATSDVVDLTDRIEREDLTEEGFRRPTTSLRPTKDAPSESESKLATTSSHHETAPVSTASTSTAKTKVEPPKRKRGRPPKPKRGRPPKPKPSQDALSQAQALLNGGDDAEDDFDDSEDGLSKNKPPHKKKATHQEGSEDEHYNNGAHHEYSPTSATSDAARAAAQHKKSKSRIEGVYGTANGDEANGDSGIHGYSRPKTSESGTTHPARTTTASSTGDETDALVQRILSSSRPDSSSKNFAPTASTTARDYTKYIESSGSSDEEADDEPFDARKALETARAKKNASTTVNGSGGSSELDRLRREVAELRQLYAESLRENELAKDESETVVEEWKQYCQTVVDKGQRYKEMAKTLYQRSEEDKAEIERLQTELEAAGGAEAQKEREILVQHNTALKAEVDTLQESMVAAEASHRRKLTKLETQHKKDQDAITKLTELSLLYEDKLESVKHETQAKPSSVVDVRKLRSLEMEVEELRQENEDISEQFKRLKRERDSASDLARSESEKAKELLSQLDSMQSRLNDAEARQETLLHINNSVSTARAPEWNPSVTLGPLESFLSVSADPESTNKWNLQCRNPKTQSELHFSIKVLEDSLEYVPMDFKEFNGAGDPADLPDYLQRPIYFEPASLAPFLAKMLGFLYRART